MSIIELPDLEIRFSFFGSRSLKEVTANSNEEPPNTRTLPRQDRDLFVEEPATSNLLKQLEELHIIQCSLLPGEELSLVLPPDERQQWENAILSSSEASKAPPSVQPPSSTCRFQIIVANAPARVEIEFPIGYPGCGFAETYVRGDELNRSGQEELQRVIKDAQVDLQGADTE